MGLGEYLKNRQFMRLQKLLTDSVQPHYLDLLEASEQASEAFIADIATEDDLVFMRGLKLRAEVMGQIGRAHV